MIRILRGGEVCPSDLDALVTLSTDVFPSKFIIPVETLKSWYKRNQDIFIIAKADDRVVGYFIAIPLTTKAYKKTYREDFDDRNISAKDIRKYDKRGVFPVHFCSIAIDPLYDFSRLFYKKIMGGFVDLLYELSAKDIFVSEVSANAVSKGGEKLCSFLKMRPLKTLDDGTKIFFTNTVPEVVCFLSKNGRKVYDVYGARESHLQSSDNHKIALGLSSSPQKLRSKMVHV